MKTAEIIGVVADLATIYDQVKTMPSSVLAVMVVVLFAMTIIRREMVK